MSLVGQLLSKPFPLSKRHPHSHRDFDSSGFVDDRIDAHSLLLHESIFADGPRLPSIRQAPVPVLNDHAALPPQIAEPRAPTAKAAYRHQHRARINPLVRMLPQIGFQLIAEAALRGCSKGERALRHACPFHGP